MCIIIGFHTGLAGGMQNAVQTGNKGFDEAALCMPKSIFQPSFTCSKVKMETLEQCVKSVQNWQQTPEGSHWHRSGVVNFEQISHIFLVVPLMILNK